MNALYQKTSFLLVINRRMSIEFLLSHFQHVTPEIWDVPNMRTWHGNSYVIPIEFFAFANSVVYRSVYEVLAEVMKKVDKKRFLSPMELLIMNWTQPGLQIRYQIITPKFSLGPSPEALRKIPDRSRHGEVLSLTESFDGFPIGPEICFAITTETDIDRGTFEETLKTLVSFEQSFA